MAEAVLPAVIGRSTDLQTGLAVCKKKSLSGNAICLEPQTEATAESVIQHRVVMNNEDIPIEDIVLLQLFKDNLLSSSLEQAKGVMFDSVSTVCPVSDSSALSTDDSSSLSDLDSVLSQDTRHHLPSWPEPECEEASQGYSNTPPDVTETGGTLKNFGLSGKRLGKDEKLAKEAKIPFTVKVGGLSPLLLY